MGFPYIGKFGVPDANQLWHRVHSFDFPLGFTFSTPMVHETSMFGVRTPVAHLWNA